MLAELSTTALSLPFFDRRFLRASATPIIAPDTVILAQEYK